MELKKLFGSMYDISILFSTLELIYSHCCIMKRTILLLLATALSGIAFGQEIPDYLAEGKFWSRYRTLATPDEPTCMVYEWFDGSDTINGVVWKKLFAAGRSDLQDKRFSGWYRQEGKKIYERRTWKDGDELISLLFDFGAQEGDTVFVHNCEYQVIDRVFDTIFDPSDGKMRRCFEVRFVSWPNSLKSIDKNFWVEGIGSLDLGITGSSLSYSGSRSELLCCKKDDTLWYQNTLYNACAINTDYEEVDYLEEGKEWIIQTGRYGKLWYYPVSVSGEVERCGQLWKRVLMDSQEFLLHRQEKKKIWGLYPYSDGLIDTVPFLMFDFGLEKGDTAHLYVDTIQHIDDVWIVEDVFDSVFEQGQAARRCQSVYLMKNPEEKDIWVEGLGSLVNGLVYSPYEFIGALSLLVCVRRATGDVLYHKYKTCDIPDNLGYDYSVQNWSVLCKDTQNTYRTQWLYFKETGKQQWNRAYLSTKEDFSDERPYGWYYQEMLQVYFKESENDPAELLYDFGLRKGESVLGRSNVLWTADTVYRVEIDGVERICQQMVSNRGDSDTWIEGLGSLKTGFLPADFCGNSMELLCVQADVWWHRGYMYHNAKYSSCHIEETDIRETSAHDVEVHYNAQQKELVIGNDSRIDVLEVVDAQGRCVLRVTEPGQSVSVARLPQGLYVYRLWGNGIICSGKFVR